MKKRPGKRERRKLRLALDFERRVIEVDKEKVDKDSKNLSGKQG